ncbi:MAG: hypothetical protein V8Q91_08605 [Bilophila wadsworthia]|uniref:hypothetical protein n=1 Tax=Bilophila wadsworthia TaxID=35833 RepID=UPI00300F75B7
MGGKLRRFVQASCLVLFCLLLGTAETGSFFGLPSDLFLRLDPLVGTAIPLVTRTIIPALFPAVFTILLAPRPAPFSAAGCCPMGATLDIFGSAARRLLGRGKSGKRHVSAPVPRSLKYLVLAVILTAALCGANLAFWASPIPRYFYTVAWFVGAFWHPERICPHRAGEHQAAFLVSLPLPGRGLVGAVFPVRILEEACFDKLHFLRALLRTMPGGDSERKSRAVATFRMPDLSDMCFRV